MGEDTVAMAKSKKVEKLLKGSQKFASAPATPCIRDEKADISAYKQGFWMVLRGRKDTSTWGTWSIFGEIWRSVLCIVALCTQFVSWQDQVPHLSGP